MERITPSEKKAQAIRELLAGEVKQTGDGAGMLSELVRLSTERVIQELLEQEQTEFLGRERYERHGDSTGQRNGYEDKRLRTAEGVLKVQVPQVRAADSKPYRSRVMSCLSNKSDALEKIVTEMWALGLSVRDVESAMMVATGSFVLSDTAVSQVTESLYKQYEAFRTRDLSGFDVAYLFIDAVYEPLRRYGTKMAVLCAWGICSDGRRILLNLMMGNSESYETCIDFLRDMVQRGMRAPLTVTTDGAPGIIQATDALWPKSWRIRCWFHKMQNLMSKVPPEAWIEFKAMVRDVRDAPDFEEGKKRLQDLVAKKGRDLPEACRCLQDDIEASLNHLHVPYPHRQMVRTTNLVERTFVEERRRTKTIPHLFDEKSLIKLVFSTLIRVSERWGRRQFNNFEEQQIKLLRRTLQLEEREEKPQPQSIRQRRSAGQVAL